MASNSGKESPKCIKLTFYFTILVAVLLIFILNLVFLITRYGITASSIKCEQSVEDDNLTTTKVNHEYIFTVIMYAIVNCLHIVEYLILGKQFYIFFFQQKTNQTIFSKECSKRFCYLFLFMLPYFMLGFAIPGLGIYQEIEHTERLAKCYRHYHEIFITYCVVNILRYASAFTVCIVIINTALYIDKLWCPDEGPCTGVSNNLCRSICRCINSRTRTDNAEQMLLRVSTDHQANYQTSDRPDNGNSEDQHQPHTTCICSTTCKLFQKVIEDWKKVSTDFKGRVEEYNKIGKEVQIYQELFQTWFIVPWVICFINSSLKSNHVLLPWNSTIIDGDGSTPPSNIPNIYYVMINIIQFITLIVPFLCAKRINTKVFQV